MNRERALLKNTIIIAIGTILPKMTTFITLPVITASLTQIEYGTYDLITTLVSFFLPMFTLQVQAAAFRFLIEYRGNKIKTKSVITNILFFIIPVSILSLFVLFFALYKLSIIIRLLICIYFFVNILVLTARQIVRGLSNNLLYSISAVVESALNMILVVGILKIADQGIVGLLLSLTLATITGLLILIIKGKIISNIDIKLLSKDLLKQILKYSWPLVPHVLSDWILRLSDRLVITFFLGLNATAIYAVANKIPSLLALIQTTFTYAWQENASLAAKDTDKDAYYTQMFELMSRILSGGTALLIAATPVLFKILIKGNYAEAYAQMPILFLGTLFSVFASFIGGIYIAHKRTINMGLTTIAAAGVNLVLDLMLINYIGIYAASVSTLMSYFFLSLYRLCDIKKYHQINVKVKNTLMYLSFLIAMCVMCWRQSFYLNILNGLIGLVFAVVINHKLINNILINILGKVKNKER